MLAATISEPVVFWMGRRPASLPSGCAMRSRRRTHHRAQMKKWSLPKRVINPPLSPEITNKLTGNYAARRYLLRLSAACPAREYWPAVRAIRETDLHSPG